ERFGVQFRAAVWGDAGTVGDVRRFARHGLRLEVVQTGAARGCADVEGQDSGHRRHRTNPAPRDASAVGLQWRPMPQPAPFGSWRSPISAAAIASDAVPLAMPDILDGDVYWLEGKPREGGRIVVVRLSGADQQRTELTPAPFNVRT